MNNSSAVIVGRVSNALAIKDVPVGDETRKVGNLLIVADKQVKKGDRIDKSTTNYEVSTWSAAQQEEWAKLKVGDGVLVRGQLEAQPFSSGNIRNGLNLRISNAEITALDKVNAGVQSIVAIGRVTSDFVISDTTNGHKVARIPVALNHGKTGDADKTSYVEVEVWDKKAETMGQLLSKGSLISVSGELELNSYTRADETKGAKLRIVNADIQTWDKKAAAAKPSTAAKSNGSGAGSGAAR